MLDSNATWMSDNVIAMLFNPPETEGDGGIAIAPAPEGHAHTVANVARLEPA